ncbi:WD repeat-containing protein 43-like [Watersipora subatra]|uniref:WD repeat-containing protein 43-like n=1 Tax=Watersipora subatra TaxID=2589382 RepID=UPI00355B200E
MDTSGSCVFDVEHTTKNVACTSSDGVLRIWDSESVLLKNEFLPSAHLAATCTCIKWRSFRCSTPHQKKKRSRKSAVSSVDSESQQDDSSVVALGSAAGNVYLYCSSKGTVQCQLGASDAAAITSLCWSNDCLSLYSGHADGSVVHWNITTAKHIRKWKCSKSSVSNLSLCGSTHLISASRTISMWNLESFVEEKTFTGHATDILRVHCIVPEDSPVDANSVHVVSVANDDRVISLWSPKSKSSNSKRAKASFILEDEPRWSSLRYDRDLGSLKIAVQTTGGTVEIFSHLLNSAPSKKPIKAFSRVRLSTLTGKALPILVSDLTSMDSLLLMYGSVICPAFENLELASTDSDDVHLKRADPSKSNPVTRVTSVGNVRKPKTDGNVTTLTPAVEGGGTISSKKSRTKKHPGKRSLDEPEITIEERLALLRGSSGDKPTDMTGPLESLATLLSQGLQSDDSTILNKTLMTSDPKIINTTVRRLPLSCVMPLMKHLTARLEVYGSRAGMGGVAAHTSLVKWLRALLHIHASYLATFPGLMERLQRMYSIMENRVSQLGTFSRLQGRLELILSQIARQKDDGESVENSTALLTLQDESSEDEMLDDLDMMMAHSESEDGYLSADEDDLMKAQ